MTEDSSATVTETGPRWQGLAAVADGRTRALVLGSFPGMKSLQQAQYYAHPQNQFWPLLQALWPLNQQPPRTDYAGRCEWLLARGLGLWDVYASCEREGSLDSAIRAAQVNDFAGLRQRCPDLQLALHNGGESYKHARQTEALGLIALKLPSTSPANASWSFDKKLQAWRHALAAHGLL
ncbi:DNA-deoxyinosine glycosylase [Comamonas thiooxydans]|uniref:DNA-deoxyinosine glycosylase n=1 Tax=Comamonas thiooxydans TaxID=363952 RepID=UPI000708F422|nr:DNA-deoxyinosine glycosylase [Comamonas thiooxydans]